MRYLKAALVGLLGGLIVPIATVAVAFVIAQRRLADSMQCVDGMCDGAVQFVHVRYLGAAFLVGFAAAFAWFLRAHRRPI